MLLPAAPLQVDSADSADDAAEPDAEAVVDTRSAIVNAAQHGQRLDKTLVNLAPEFSRSHLQQLIDKGHVQVDGTVASTASRRLRIGQALHLELVPTEESQAFDTLQAFDGALIAAGLHVVTRVSIQSFGGTVGRFVLWCGPAPRCQ